MSTTLMELRVAHNALHAAIEAADLALLEAANQDREIGELLSHALAGLADQPSPRTVEEARRSLPQFCWPIASDMGQAIPARLDALLYDQTPVECVPRHGAFRRLTIDGHRYLVATDGLWLEVHRPWPRLLWPIGTTSPENLVSTHATPFGTLKPSVEIIFGKIPHHLIRSFAERGRTSCPNERGAWLSWEHGHEGTEGRLVWSEPVDSVGTPGALHYARPEHTADLSPCIDLHTHGTAPAFFSATDDQDDAHDVKIAIVIGNLDRPIPTIAARLCCLGVFIPVTVRAEEVFGGAT